MQTSSKTVPANYIKERNQKIAIWRRKKYWKQVFLDNTRKRGEKKNLRTRGRDETQTTVISGGG